MLTFEQVQPALHKWARYFSNDLFDHWELVSEVWLMGNVQKLPHLRLASNRIKFDMIDYMRSACSYRNKKRADVAGRFYPKTFSLSSVKTDISKDTECLQERLESKPDLCKVDMKDYFAWLLKGFSHGCKLIIILRYECGYDFRVIAKIIGVTASRVSQIHEETLLRLRQKLIDAGEQSRTCIRAIKVRHRPTDERRFYDRRYYALNKERILRRRKERQTA